MNEIMRKQPAVIVAMEPLPNTMTLVGIERPIVREEAPRNWRPDLWPWWIWGPLLVSPALLLWLAVLALSLL